MTIDFTCQNCDATFEKLVCTSCEAKALPTLVEDFVAALTEMRTQVAALGKKFSLAMAFETEDLEDLDAKDAEEEDEDEDDEDDLDDEDDDLDEDEEDALYDEDEGR